MPALRASKPYGGRTKIEDSEDERQTKRARREPSPSPILEDVVAPSKKYRFQLSMDVGTTGTRCAWRIPTKDLKIRKVNFHCSKADGSYEMPTTCFYETINGLYLFVCGYDAEHRVQESIDEGRPLPELLHNIKLGFYAHIDAVEYRQQLELQLQPFGKTIMDWWQDFAKYLIRISKDDVKDVFDIKPQDLEVELFASMPDMIDPLSNQPICDAAKAIGVVETHITQESICFFSSVFVDIEGPEGREAEACYAQVGYPGEIAIIVDLGGGYATTSGHRILLPGSQSRLPGLEAVGNALSQPCGSTRIDEGFQKAYLQSDKIKKIASDMGFTYKEFIHTASAVFSEAKEEFPEKKEYRIAVPGKKDAIRESWRMYLTKEQIEELFDPVVSVVLRTIRKMIACIEDGGRETVKTLIAGGGFSRNRYVKSAINELARQVKVRVLFRADHDYGRVARGALERYNNPRFVGFQKNFNLGICRDEEIDLKHHQDIIIEYFEQRTPVNGKKSGKVQKVPKFHELSVKKVERETTIWLAADRVHWLIRSVPGNQRAFKTYVSWSVDYPEIGQPYVYKPDLVYSESTELRDHEPFYDHKGDPQPHLKFFADETRVNIPYPDAQDWDIHNWPNGARTYEIAIRTEVFVSDAGFEISCVVKRLREMPSQRALKARKDKIRVGDAGSKVQIMDHRHSTIALA